MTNFIISLVVLLLFSFPAMAGNEMSAEIVNINYPQKVVFIDLGRDQVKVGDLFSVEHQQGIMYLEALEVADVISKLGLSRQTNFQSEPQDFDNLIIGARALKVTGFNQGAETSVALPVASNKADVSVPVSLNSGTAADQIQVQQLIKENLELKKKLEKIDLLKERLDVINKTIAEQLKP